MAASGGSGGFDDAREFWDQRFRAPGYIFGTEPNVFLAAQAHRFRPGHRVLDVACGEGRNSVWLAGLGCDVLGLDISPLALDKARRLASGHAVAVEYVEADIRDWKWQPERFDAVVCIFIQFAEPNQRARLFEGIKTTLKAGGVLVLQGYTPKQVEYKTGGPPRADHMYTRLLLQDAFADLEILHLREHEEVLAEGVKHVGRSALIDLVVRKRIVPPGKA
ncbi:MAG TPA: class I SAM-dependent methyltransferase [Burkholderiales bacterium]|nr:class I SAM-dependent methyltransferase [Burkholderiales bacterium]